jgi:hypothetical protein
MKIKGRLVACTAFALAIVFGGPTLPVGRGQESTASERQRQVRVYFPRDGNPHPRDPFNLQFVVRNVAASAPARPALESLLAGPTTTEKRRRLRALDAEGLRVGSLVIGDGVARVDFVSRGGKRWAGDLSPAEFRHAVERTLKQFSTVRRVAVSVDGKTNFDSSR